MNHISEISTIKQFTKPPETKQPDTRNISTFPTSPLDMPPTTFENALKNRQENQRKLIQWIKRNLEPDIHYGRVHIAQNCPHAKADAAYLCRDFSHFSGLTLWKAGAEKILTAMGLTAHFPNIGLYEEACLRGLEIKQVLLKCELKTHGGRVVAEGAGARHLRKDNWRLNTSIKMAQKSAMIDATIRVAGLTGIFIKTHRHTLKNKFPRKADCHDYNFPPRVDCRSTHPNEKAITHRQKDFIHKLAGIKGHTTAGLNRLIHERFNKRLDNLNRVEASRFIEHING